MLRGHAVRDSEGFPAGPCVVKCAKPYTSAGSARDGRWWQVRAGMLLEVRDGEDSPADLLCLHCASAHHVCYIAGQQRATVQAWWQEARWHAAGGVLTARTSRRTCSACTARPPTTIC